jgi:small subunit ribosomal protein S6
MERRQGMREYELYLVIDADADEEEVGAILEKVTALISAGHGGAGGEVIKVDTRGKRRLAYSINKTRESQDVILTLQVPPQALAELERVLKLDEQVLRYLLVRTDEK